MRKEISVVTDSSSSLWPELAKQKEISIVSDLIIFKDKQFKDGLEIGTEELLQMMQQKNEIPTTAAPSIGDYKVVYDDILHRFPDRKIFSVHLTSKKSNVYNAACLAAKEYEEGKINTYDSETISMGIGFMALKASQLAQKGATIEQIRTELDDMKQRMTVYAAIDSLQHLKKGGRLSTAGYLFAAGLQIKPIIEIAKGELTIKDKTRTRGKSIDRLIELTNIFAQNGIEEVAVLHAGAEDDALKIVHGINKFYKGNILILEAGAVLTVHGGPKVAGVVVVKK